MLTVDQSLTPTRSNKVHDSAQAQGLAQALIAESISFYCEPLPDGAFLFQVNAEARHRLDFLVVKVMDKLP
jgi:hypothetical protein